MACPEVTDEFRVSQAVKSAGRRLLTGDPEFDMADFLLRGVPPSIQKLLLTHWYEIEFLTSIQCELLIRRFGLEAA